MIFIELVGVLVLFAIFGVGAWHVFKHLTQKGEGK